jgi:hypothetical protein
MLGFSKLAEFDPLLGDELEPLLPESELQDATRASAHTAVALRASRPVNRPCWASRKRHTMLSISFAVNES